MNGVIYLASGPSYIKEAERSALSLKQHHQQLPITIYTDEKIHSDVFDDVISLEHPIRSMGDSLLSEKYIPYDRNLYLDVDTYIDGNVTDLFDLLDVSDLAVAENPGAGCWNEPIYQNMELEFPESFPEFNSGVMVYKDSEKIKDFFSEWNDYYSEIDREMVPYETNQPALRAALYRSNIKYITLRKEYNFQINHHRSARRRIKIFHDSYGSPVDLEPLARAANSFKGDRAITFDDYPCRVIPTGQYAMKYKMKRFLRNEEYRKLIKIERLTSITTTELWR